MTRSIASLSIASALLLTPACAQSVHQGERLGTSNGSGSAGYADAPPFWRGSDAWWNPFGYYGSSYGWYGGGYSDATRPSTAPAPPANAPPQFQKKYWGYDQPWPNK